MAAKNYMMILSKYFFNMVLSLVATLKSKTKKININTIQDLIRKNSGKITKKPMMLSSLEIKSYKLLFIL